MDFRTVLENEGGNFGCWIGKDREVRTSVFKAPELRSLMATILSSSVNVMSPSVVEEAGALVLTSNLMLLLGKS